ncbi:TPA: TIGR01440 family protein, partial [Streptococcus suis]|nr:TIGR01440 family protein [Streptococcus suis]
MSLREIKDQTQQVVQEVLELSNLQKGQIFVLGLSSSEVIGGHIGKNSSLEVGEVVVETILEILDQKGIYLAVQGCEHLNRALLVERELAIQKDLEIVNVLPTLHAGGSGQLAAFKYMKDPVE